MIHFLKNNFPYAPMNAHLLIKTLKTCLETKTFLQVLIDNNMNIIN